MDKVKTGNIVGRKSYGKDIIFIVTKIIEKENIAILKGVYERIEADSPISDLELIEEKVLAKKIEDDSEKLEHQIIDFKRQTKEKKLTGKILHLDGECSFIYTLQSCLNTEFKKK